MKRRRRTSVDIDLFQKPLGDGMKCLQGIDWQHCPVTNGNGRRPVASTVGSIPSIFPASRLTCHIVQGSLHKTWGPLKRARELRKMGVAMTNNDHSFIATNRDAADATLYVAPDVCGPSH